MKRAEQTHYFNPSKTKKVTKVHVVTSGLSYLDIDAYGGCIAYTELLNLEGVKASAISTAPLNESVTDTIRSWDSPLVTSYSPSASDTFALIDVSDPSWFDAIVVPERITEVIDHHPGFEAYWKERLGDKARIEPIGAACTQVYERWLESNRLKEMSQLSARLLIFGILDNTLNFGAHITSDRDHTAYSKLLEVADLPSNHVEEYFRECQEAILEDPATALRNDSKAQIDGYDKPVAFGQMVVWDAREVVADYGDIIRQTMTELQPSWFMNIVSICDGRSTLMCNSADIRNWVGPIMGIDFGSGETAIADRLWLRKEINRASLDAAK